jgi:hypothetical protein
VAKTVRRVGLSFDYSRIWAIVNGKDTEKTV